MKASVLNLQRTLIAGSGLATQNSRRHVTRLLLVGWMLTFATGTTIIAQDSSKTMLTAEVLPLAKTGEVDLIDIRSPEEWSQTGVAEFAKTNSMHVPGFLERLNEMLGGDKERKIALICATGGRSSYLQQALRNHGYNNVIDVTDGMIGSGSGPGWLGNGFTTRKVQ